MKIKKGASTFTVGESYRVTNGYKIGILKVLERKDNWLTVTIDGGKPANVRAWPVFAARRCESILLPDYNTIYSYEKL